MLSSNSDSMSCVYMNSTGKYQVATSIYTSSTTNLNIYTSNDYGITFVMRSTITANNFGCFIEGASIDETGQYFFCLVVERTVYKIITVKIMV